MSDTTVTLENGAVVRILLHGEVQLMDWGESRTAGPWIKLRLDDPSALDVFRGLDPGEMKREQHVLYCTIANGDMATGAAAPSARDPEPRHGVAAKALRLSGFFLRPEVWRAVGSDAQFLHWCKRQRCASCRSENGVVPAHVRRIADGAGTAIKPAYSAIPLCNDCHGRQHQYGEATLGDEDWWARQRIDAVRSWAWETLKAALGHDSWASVPPHELAAWTAAHFLPDHWLPEPYRLPTDGE